MKVALVTITLFSPISCLQNVDVEVSGHFLLMVQIDYTSLVKLLW